MQRRYWGFAKTFTAFGQSLNDVKDEEKMDGKKIICDRKPNMCGGKAIKEEEKKYEYKICQEKKIGPDKKKN